MWYIDDATRIKCERCGEMVDDGLDDLDIPDIDETINEAWTARTCLYCLYVTAPH